MIKSILCAVEGVPRSFDALRYAARLARDLSASLVLLHVEAEPRGGVLFSAFSPDEPPDEDHWNSIVSGLLGHPVEVHYATGDIAQEIVRFANKVKVDLIVLGSSARNPASLAIASAVGGVLPHAPCPVTVVPAGSEAAQSGESEAA
ncbi:MAG TPA: universal stress protein [Myxococcales bacterium]|nr:universal stress protein [Myxococcales bacterium]